MGGGGSAGTRAPDAPASGLAAGGAGVAVGVGVGVGRGGAGGVESTGCPLGGAVEVLNVVTAASGGGAAGVGVGAGVVDGRVTSRTAAACDGGGVGLDCASRAPAVAGGGAVRVAAGVGVGVGRDGGGLTRGDGSAAARSRVVTAGGTDDTVLVAALEPGATTGA